VTAEPDEGRPAAARANLLDLLPDEAERVLAEYLAEAGEPLYRARQVVQRLWSNPAPDFASMTELPTPLRGRLAARFDLPRPTIAARQRSSDGTEKFLFRLGDGEAIETVAIPEGSRLTLCISSQAGCALRCSFCATGRMGFSRNLAAWEIAGQVREMRLLSPPIGVTNVVFMGMGEPLMNWTAGHITISTVGVLPGIVALSQRPEQFRLAISIHAPTDDLRRQLMPINTKYPLADVIEAAKAFDRRVTFEYVMLGGVNDAEEHALELARLARECGAFVNLIPLHPGGAEGFHPTPPEEILAFARELRREGVEVAIRRSRGVDIAAACGQLRVERLGRRAPRRADQDRHVDVA
jgi:23S rRNA (adenine2503-C2)-methyltransferase